MLAIPAIDIRGGEVVRLSQGEYSRQTTYGSSPLDTALKWDSYGAGIIHVVDLDGALFGELKNLNIVSRIASSVKARIQLGGGIRSESDVKKVFDAGVSKAVIGTRALDRDFIKSLGSKFGDRLVVGIDAKNGVVAVRGWTEDTNIMASDLAAMVKDCGITTINYTDISRDGMLTGPNIEGLRQMLKCSGLSVVAAGGVSSIEDVRRLKSLEDEGLKGVIIGKALYEGKVDLKEAIQVCLQKE